MSSKTTNQPKPWRRYHCEHCEMMQLHDPSCIHPAAAATTMPAVASSASEAA
ncbi:hypothetical protein RhiirA5_406037 [Rhizophagus irregularis]|uniref:Uncharacterized protein n=2 Tax=Rhizophagus irregularis TaxID=588596 RepID=U9TAF8_RHIID|nr:hypothetical protein GLOIN_2v1778434 [Rhizophagus irregularis DAOM 181602=DAOM 197198]PKC17268.1 hypothetical protein RhiirA5_406037 [Rhizophagus irregularis]PKC71967.1 hypothetical protein RhiirA1_452929 [Rhizophagus irregularis]PKK80564.1 hypothetical protein RhiirC2_767916 [Rhizophagus irregularis]PKY14465.1 hypothetical protein RhiirB3_426464 [Rhizophagus irregularis]POG68310.1 hypothetical protein GLOIN_2v1778434 [Rhizophagus irregularis DAOM 181602=DAOM 197198]|eukprot:XP_025175176.1 hypothetical protein GLOIN_2v1778434 [Rhizophagus irregularis DAOM 181602=DAOM 197198]